MKNNIFTLLIMFLTSFVIGQKDLYLTLGLNRSSVRTDIPNIVLDHKSDYFIGIRTHVLKKERLSLATEVQYSRKGWRLEGLNKEGQTFNYIDGIHTVNYKASKSLNIYGGINTGFLLNNNSLGLDKIVDVGLLSGLSTGNKYVEFFGQYNYGFIKNNISLTSQQKFGMMNNGNLQMGFRFSLLEDKIRKPKEPKISELKDTIANNIVPKDTSKLVTKDFVKVRELGVSTFSLSNFSVLYKKRVEENKYLRYDLSYISFEADNLESEIENVSANFQFGYGIEKRKQVENFEFLHGWMYRLSLGYLEEEYFIIRPTIGYLVGLQYNYKKNWNFGLELMPNFSLDINTKFYKRENETIINSRLAFYNSPNFFITYKFMDDRE